MPGLVVGEDPLLLGADDAALLQAGDVEPSAFVDRYIVAPSGVQKGAAVRPEDVADQPILPEVSPSRLLLSVAVPLRDPTGAVSEWVGTLTDIDDQERQTHVLERMVRERTAALEETNLVLTGEVAERKAAEEQVRAVAAELERSNDELEKFAYIASHDLQEPLRKIQAFGDRLLARSGPALDEPAADYLRRMLEAAGYPVEWHAYPMPHSVVWEEVEAIRAFLARILP